MAYIGRSVDIGNFEKQVLTPDSSTTTFTLSFGVGSANSLLVVYGGVIQEPNVAYALSGGGLQIVFSEAPVTGTTLYIVYLGKQMLTPRAAGQETTKQSFTGDAVATQFTLTDPPVVPAGIMVFVDGILQREGAGANYVSSGSTINFSTAPDFGAEIDVYTLVKEKVSIDTVADGSITRAKLAQSAPYWDAQGNFGIGAALAGAAKLEVTGDTGIAAYITQTGTPTNNAVAIKSDNASTYAMMRLWANQTTGNSIFLRFSTDSNSQVGAVTYDRANTALSFNANNIALLPTANVMIGTSTAYGAAGGGTTKLTVSNDVNDRVQLAITNQSTGGSAAAALTLGAYGADWTWATGSTAKNSNALTLTYGASNVRLTVYNNGNVTIGSTNQSNTTLSVGGTITAGTAGSTNGSTFIQNSYSGSDYISLIGEEYSTGAVSINYACKNSTSDTGFTSSADNVAWSRAYLKVGGNWAFRAGYASSALVTKGTAVNLVDTVRSSAQSFNIYSTNATNSTNATFVVNNASGTDIICEAMNNSVPSISGFRIAKITSSGRSINASGTVNQNGADYAEYMRKSGVFTIAKGDICGIDVNGELTNVFADSLSFVVKSTNPGLVGGDTWFTEPRPKDEEGNEVTSDTPEYAEWNEKMEAARTTVDRIAFCGQVPVNVTGATPGQWIIPVNDNGSIKGEAVTSPSFEQYQTAVGKVIAIEEDGRARIIVKIA